MSEYSIERIYATFAADVEAACADGRGGDLFLRFISALAVDHAESVFLRMDAEAANATDDTIGDVFAWLQAFPVARGAAFIADVSTTLLGAGGNDDQRGAAERTAAEAFQARLDTLIAQVERGGSA